MKIEQAPMPENYVSVPPTPVPNLREAMNKATQEFIVLSKTFYHELLKPGISDVDLCQALRNNTLGHGVHEMMRFGAMLNLARRPKEDCTEEDLEAELDKMEFASGLIMISKGLFCSPVVR